MSYILISQLKTAPDKNGLHRMFPRAAVAWHAGAAITSATAEASPLAGQHRERSFSRLYPLTQARSIQIRACDATHSRPC